MSGNESVGAFTAVDETENSHWFVDFMDLANSLPEYREVREILSNGIAGSLSAVSGGSASPHSRRVLDVGCGTGDDARELQDVLGRNADVLGVDVSTEMLATASARNAGRQLAPSFELADIEKLSYESESFDAVRVKLVRQHCANLDLVDAELVRVIKPGGVLAVFEYDFDTLVIDHPDVAATRQIVRGWSDSHQNPWNGRQLRRRFKEQGIAPTRITPRSVQLPFAFLDQAVGTWLRTSEAIQSLASEGVDASAWWQRVEELNQRDEVYAALTGFVLIGRKMANESR